jgi:HlyD family secretion protein
MKKIFHSIFNTFKNLLRSKIFIGIIIVLVLCVGGYFLFFHHSPKYQFITVKTGSITESVSLTGNTTPAQSVSLTFNTSGIISHTYSDLGKAVRKGQVLAELNTSDLLAQLHQAQATLDVENARLAGLQSGSRPEDIAIAKVNLDNAKADLENTKVQQATLVGNAYRALLNSTLSAYSTTSTDITATTVMPVVSGTYDSGTEGAITIQTISSGGGGYFNASGLVTATGTVSTNSTPIGASGLFISFPQGYNVSSGIAWTIPIPNTRASNYITNLNLYNSSLATQNTALTQGQATVSQLQAQLDLKQAGSTPTDISAQEAQVAQAKASLQSASAKLENAQIISPINGVVTQFDAKIGQFASQSTPLVSIMSDTGYEVDAGVSEMDVGKVSVGDKVTMTLDAFPGQTFTGSVFYIAPAQTNIQGVITYQTKISFDKPDPLFKSGLTANINIETNHKDNVLILPQYAILQNDQGTFVKTLVNTKIVESPVTLGLQDQKGNVEVISGVTDSEQVLNIGLKTQ